ncbi:hypothetical protein PR048_007868 [Dryococelus australis]|uniref:Uncharacterized protein n=1 Tax=Dryococelus australis TaxID=614101 RepID=A0ABQ9HVG8_9NEOP|nr:hypothetical protein PR048_007868 [Dryococelus australis]
MAGALTRPLPVGLFLLWLPEDGRRSGTRDQLLQAITDVTNQLRNEHAVMQWQHAMVGYNVSQPAYGLQISALSTIFETRRASSGSTNHTGAQSGVSKEMRLRTVPQESLNKFRQASKLDFGHVGEHAQENSGPIKHTKKKQQESCASWSWAKLVTLWGSSECTEPRLENRRCNLGLGSSANVGLLLPEKGNNWTIVIRQVGGSCLQIGLPACQLPVVGISAALNSDVLRANYGDPRENPLTNGIVRHDSHMQKSASVSSDCAEQTAHDADLRKKLSRCDLLQRHLLLLAAGWSSILPRSSYGHGVVKISSIGSYLDNSKRAVNKETPARHPPRLTGGVAPGVSHTEIVVDDTAGRRVFSGIPPPFFLHFGASPYSPHFTLIGSRDLDVEWMRPVSWPARSPDLSPLDFFFCDCLKSRVYSGRRSGTRDQLLQAITDVTNQLRNEHAGMQWQHAMVGYNVSQPAYGLGSFIHHPPRPTGCRDGCNDFLSLPATLAVTSRSRRHLYRPAPSNPPRRRRPNCHSNGASRLPGLRPAPRRRCADTASCRSPDLTSLNKNCANISYFSKSYDKGIWAALNIEVLRADEGEMRWEWSSAGMQRLGKWEIPEKTRRYDFHLQKSGVTRPEFEPEPMRVKRGVYGAVPERRGGNRRSPRKPADQLHRSARIPHAKIREQLRRESNPSRLDGARLYKRWQAGTPTISRRMRADIWRYGVAGGVFLLREKGPQELVAP